MSKAQYIIFSVTLIAVMGVATITPVFPEVIKHFELKPEQVGSLIVVFTLPGIFLIPITGVLADRIGRKAVLIPSLLIFAFAGTACGFAQSFQWLLVFRFLQGFGAASLGSLNVTLIGDLYSGNRRAKIMGYNAAVLSVGTASYPVIGGFLGALSWNYVFFMPIAAAPLALWASCCLKNPELQQQFDLKTYFKKAAKAINRKAVWALFIINILVFIILYGSFLVYFPVLAEERLELGALGIGLYMAIMSATTAVVSSQKGRINKILLEKTQFYIGAAAYMTACLILVFAANTGFTIAGLIIFGFGHGIMIPGIYTVLAKLSSVKERAIFMSINSLVLRVGQTAGPAIAGIYYTFAKLPGAFAGGAAGALIMLLVIFLLFKIPKSEAKK